MVATAVMQARSSAVRSTGEKRGRKRGCKGECVTAGTSECVEAEVEDELRNASGDSINGSVVDCLVLGVAQPPLLAAC